MVQKPLLRASRIKNLRRIQNLPTRDQTKNASDWDTIIEMNMASMQFEFDIIKQSFGVDLVPLAKQHIQFLKRLHERGISFTKLSAESLRRYQELWLPLVFRYPQENLIPPDDIAWLWHCHRLAPHRYQAYLKRTFGTDCPILDARPAFRMQSDDDHFVTQDEDQTKELWEAVYPNEPFLMSNEKGPHSMKEDSHTTEGVRENLLDGFDLLEATERQATFLWQISGPRFSDTAFLEEGLINYCKFLLLKRDASSEIQIIVPTYQIDLMWHTHMLSGLKGYFEDCQRIIGSVLYHDDNISDRSEGSALNVAFTETNCLWKERYGQDYNVLGGMYRGEPPVVYYSVNWSAASEIDCIPMGPYLRYVNVQGASSAVPGTNAARQAPTSRVQCCWKEEPQLMGFHAPGSIVGDPSNCWISYDNEINDTLEAAFLGDGGAGTCTPVDGFTVDHISMTQREESTGCQKLGQRFVENSLMGVHSSLEESDIELCGALRALPFSETVNMWTQPKGLSQDGKRGFIPAKTDYPASGILANSHIQKNPRKKDYVFGNECMGWGYYHVTTPEAYKILSARMKAKVRGEIHNLVMKKNHSLLCCSSSQSAVILQEGQIATLRLIHSIVEARAGLEAPVGVVGIPPDLQKKPSIINMHYSDTGQWLFPLEYCKEGGGCGARVDRGFDKYLSFERDKAAIIRRAERADSGFDYGIFSGGGGGGCGGGGGGGCGGF